MNVRRLEDHPIHLGLGGRAVPQPAFTGGAWYAAYEARTAADGAEGRLVTLHAFDKDWTEWEMHPVGDELVVCLTGRMTLHQEAADGGVSRVSLGPGEYAVNPPGVWHTADVAEPATALFITAGQGTVGRPR